MKVEQTSPGTIVRLFRYIYMPEPKRHQFINTDQLPAPTKLTKQELEVWPKSYRCNINHLQCMRPGDIQRELKSLSLPCPSEVGHTSSLPSSMPHWLALSQGPDISRRDVYDWQSTQKLLTSASSAFLHTPPHASCVPELQDKKKIN